MAIFDGTSGPDTIDGTEDPDVIRGFGGDDTLRGHGGDDEIDGGDGNDSIDGGTGADFMAGHSGNDTYYVDNAGDVVKDHVFAGNDGGFDFIYTTVSYTLGQLTGEYVERLSAFDRRSTTDLALIGNALANEIWGNDGANLLDGGLGADILHGEKGDDVYFVDNTGDRTIEAVGEGYDTVFLHGLSAPPRYSLPTNVERVIATDAPNVTELSGNELANVVVGNDGANLLAGNGQNGVSGQLWDHAVDVLMGGGGNDEYRLLSNVGPLLTPTALDLVIEFADGGHDYVTTNFSYTLPEHVEDLRGAGTLVGNALDNDIRGGAGIADIIDGGAGADYMAGFEGDDIYFVDNPGDQVVDYPVNGGVSGYDTVFVADIDWVLPDGVERAGAMSPTSVEDFDLTGNAANNELWGNDGANVLDGKLGLDTLIGYGGADTFAFTTLVDGHNADLFLGFEVGVDKVALDDAVFAGLTPGALPAEAFVVGRFATDADDRILYEASTGDLFFDRDGTGPIEAQYFATMSDGLSLTASDFIVI